MLALNRRFLETLNARWLSEAEPRAESAAGIIVKTIPGPNQSRCSR